MRLNALIQARDAIKAEFRAWLGTVLESARAEGRGLSPDDESKQKDFEAKLANAEGLLRAEQRRVELAASPVAAPQATPVLDAGPVRVQVGAPNLASDPRRGFHNMGDFARAVHGLCRPDRAVAVDQRLVDGGLLAAPANQHTSSGAEGAEIPPEFRQGVWQLVFEDPLVQAISIEPTSSPVIQLTADETTPWGASGVQANWRAEGSQMSPSKLDTDPRQLRVNELYAFVLATEELLEDSPRLTDRLNRKVPEAIRWKMVEGFMFGNGVGKPLGWAAGNYAGKVTVSRAGGGAIAAPDALKLAARLKTEGGPDRSFYVGHPSTIPQLAVMTVGNQPVWLPPNGLQSAPGGTLLGRPLYISGHCSVLGTEGDLQLINPAGYLAVQRGPSRSDSSIHLYFDYATTAFRTLVRVGGMPLLKTAVSPAKGSDTLSHAVILS